MEAVNLGLFMVSACLFTVLLEYPLSPAHQAIPDPFIRRSLEGLAMGLTAIALIYSPWGRRSGAHINPAVTLSFWRLGKIKSLDAMMYILAQFIGAALGVGIMSLLFHTWVSHPSVLYVVTIPGPAGLLIAWIAECAISFLLMVVVLISTNRSTWAPYTGLAAGFLVALYIAIEAPYSGMSMNPARTFGSAFFARLWDGWWVYFTAPLVGMLGAVELYRYKRALKMCAKLYHDTQYRCIFCGWPGKGKENRS